MKKYALMFFLFLTVIVLLSSHIFGQNKNESNIVLAHNSISDEQDAASKAYKEAYKNILDEKWGEAIESLKNFIKNYKNSELEDAAAFWICFASEKNGQELEEVFKMYESFVYRYVDSKWREEVKSNLIKLGYRLLASGKQNYRDIITAYRICNNESISSKELEGFYETIEERAIKIVVDEFYANKNSKNRKKIFTELIRIKNQILVARFIAFYEKREAFIATQMVPENMVFVEGGECIWGNNSTLGNYMTKPEIKLKVNSFYIDKYEVTQKEFEKIMGYNPSIYVNPEFPVNNVSNIEALEFAKKVGKRIPTEVEWEYAARGGKKTRNYKFSGSNYMDEVGWYNENSNKTTHLVGLKKPNELGLYDMSGNVAEICYQLISDNEYSPMAFNSFLRGLSGERYVFISWRGIVRGGKWNSEQNQCYVFSRELQGFLISKKYDFSDRSFYGFRCVKDIY